MLTGSFSGNFSFGQSTIIDLNVFIGTAVNTIPLTVPTYADTMIGTADNTIPLTVPAS